MFIAKCIQDGRRVDFPLSRPFFKLMCSPGREAGQAQGVCGRQDEGGTHEPCEGGGGSMTGMETVAHEPSPTEPVSNRFQRPHSPTLLVSDSSSGSRSTCHMPSSEISAQEGAGLKEAELLMATAGEREEISKDGSGKEEVVLEELSVDGDVQSEAPWFAGILDSEDLEMVNPFRARFLEQVRMLIAACIGNRVKGQLSIPLHEPPWATDYGKC